MSGAQRWDDMFTDINNGGGLRWKTGEKVKDWVTQHANITEFVKPGSDSPARLIAPLSGDSPYVKYAWENGFDVTAVEWSSVAIGNLKESFEKEGVKFETTSSTAGAGTTVHSAPRIRLVQGDWDSFATFSTRQETGHYDVIFDKDAYGFLGPESGTPYAKALCDVLRPGGFVYLEVKNFESGGTSGPPYHISLDNINSSWGPGGCNLVRDFGKQPAPYGPGTSQMAYMLQKDK